MDYDLQFLGKCSYTTNQVLHIRSIGGMNPIVRVEIEFYSGLLTLGLQTLHFLHHVWCQPHDHRECRQIAVGNQAECLLS